VLSLAFFLLGIVAALFKDVSAIMNK
jgi:hypothetical protein